MAEGGGTVSWDSHPGNPAPHFVVEGSGRVVRMLDLGHMHTLIRTAPGAIRDTDDPPYDWHGIRVVYGRRAAAAVLGPWASTRTTLGPNHATIGVEVEGFAAQGPQGPQLAAIAGLYGQLRARFAGIRSLGHRDHQEYKACPGHRFPWDLVGGHADQELDPMTIYTSVAITGTAIIPAGQVVRFLRPTPSGSGWEIVHTRPAAATPSPALAIVERLHRIQGSATPGDLVRFAGDVSLAPGLYASTAEIQETIDPPADPVAVWNAALDRVAAAIATVPRR
jgi:hypothetical protein